ncbi:hypothetical protein [Gemmatimonas sp.]|uniref:hypothetical protein n=1 Tax=Gemmatimonas sp. TaxID=1962908 RepID=UPI00356876B8
MARDGEVIVDADLRRFPYRELVPRGRQRSERRAVGRLEDTALTAGELLKRPRVKAVQRKGHRVLELRERVKDVVPQWRQELALDDLHRSFHRGLVARMPHE